MTTLCKKLISGLLALVLLSAFASAALAEETQLQVTLTGLYATKDGTYQEVPVSGVFEVYQAEQKIADLSLTSDGSETLTLPGSDIVRIVPVEGSFPAELPVNARGYSVSITPGRLNIAPLVLYAEAGLFVVDAGVPSEFDLLDAAGESVMTFQTDEKGAYALEVAIPAGEYTLRMTDSEGERWPDQQLEILTYTDETSVLMVCTGADGAVIVSYCTPEAEAAYAEAPNPAPAENAAAVPTSAPDPTQAPAVPTAAATPTEAPAIGTLVLTAAGDEAIQVDCTVTAADGTVVGGANLSLAEPLTIPGLEQGEYMVTIQLPEDVVLTALNGSETLQRGMAQWKVSVLAAQESRYEAELTGTGSLVVLFENIEDAQVYVTGERESFELIANENGVYEQQHLLPDVYEISVQLPAGRYVYADDQQSWQLTENADGTCTFTMTVGVSRDTVTELPLISRNIIGSVSGQVADPDGKALSGVTVEIRSASGEVAARTETDKQGAWQVDALTYGDYTVQYTDDAHAIPAGSFTLSDSSLQPALTAAGEKPAKITVRAFMDDNNNGTYTKGEDYVKDVEVALVSAEGAVVASGLTDKDGYVTLSAPAGEYTLRATVPQDYGFGKLGTKQSDTHSIMAETSGRTQQSEPLTLEVGQTLKVGVGVQPMAVVTGTVWNDVNADGLWQEDEPGIPGIRVTLEGVKNGSFQEILTDENGWYEFRQVKNGSYRLTCYVPDDYVFTGKADGELAEISRMTTEKERAGEDTFTLERGEVHDNHNIGLMEGVIIEGVCFLDANSNGYYDEGDLPLPGVELRLGRQSNNVLLQTVTSDENGVYRFLGQRGSTFTIRAILPKGNIFTVTAEGEGGNRFAPNGSKTERKITDLTIEHGGYMQVMLGATQYGAISGKVYYDDDFSAAWEDGEKAAKSCTVTLLDSDGNKVDTDKTDKNGTFSFEDVMPGQYTLCMEPAQGYAFTALGDGNVMQTLPDGTGESRVITVGIGEDVTGADIGMIVPAVASGTVYGDSNDNGLMDEGETGLAGTVVHLMSENGEVSSRTVDESGAFSFNAVLPGSYYLQYTLPDHSVYAPVVSGGNAISDEGKGEWFTVESGDTWTAPLCGGVLLSDISGVTFADGNGNGVMDENEQTLSGVTITLTPTRSELEEITVVTGEDGLFAISALRPDAYTLTVVCPDACVLARMPEADMGLTHGLNSQSIPLQLSMGTQWHGQQLGCVLPSVWTGEAYYDENYDGYRAANEAPAAGETLVLLDADSREVVATVQTDENGCFTIEGVAPGEYELTYPMDAGNLEPKAGDNDFLLEDQVMTTGRVRINENEDRTGTVLAIVRTTEIAGTVWQEEYSGVTPVQGTTVRLLDASGIPVAQYVTGEDGRYAFTGLMPAAYAIDVTLPQGSLPIEDNDPRLTEANLNNVIETVEGGCGRSAVVSLRMGQHCRDMDVGLVFPGRLGDKVWLDENGNGLQDGGEGGISGVIIELLRDGQVVASTVSDQYGYYVFEELYPAEYTLRVTWPEGVIPTVRRAENWQIVSVLQVDGTSVPLTVESNKANYAADLGFALVDETVYPDGYGEGEAENWQYSK